MKIQNRKSVGVRMNTRAIFGAALVGLCLLAQGAMGAVLYQEDFTTGPGIGAGEWESTDITWNSTFGNPLGSMSWVNTSSSAIMRQNSTTTPLQGPLIPVSGDTFTASLDWYQSYASGAIPYMMIQATLADNSFDYLVVERTILDAPGVWHTYTTTKTFAQPVQFLQFYHLSFTVPDTTGLLVAVDNLSITGVPEPATWALLALSLTAVMVLRRRHS